MNKFCNMLERANLQFVADMIQTGTPKLDLNLKNLEEQEDEAVKHLKEQLEEIVSENELGNVTDIAMEYANDCCEIYFIVGMKAGAKLIYQLLNDSLKNS
ncbi:MAG: hypothetical protein HFG38_05620 [Eubacterium sp.]|nr:hypothetical protein [Eubacterium sp.]